MPCVFLGFPVDSSDYTFYHPPLHRFLDSRDVHFDESVSYFTRPLSTLRHFRDRLLWTLGVLELEGLALEVLVRGVLELEVLALEVIVMGVLELEVLALEVGAGVGGGGAKDASSGGAGAGGTCTRGASSEEAGAGGTTTAPPHQYDTRLQAARRRSEAVAIAFAAATTFAAAVPTSEWPFGPWSSLCSSCPLTIYYQSQSPTPVLPYDWTTCCPPHARPSSPLHDLRPVLFRSSPRHAPPVSALPPPPASSLTVSSHPITDYYHPARPIVLRVLASLTDPHASPSSDLALTAYVADFASTRHLDFATCVVAAPPTRPLSARGESALGCNVLEDRQFEMEFLAAALPSLCAMLRSLEGELDALDISAPCTYREAVPGPWASQWKAAMDSELASWRSTGTYVDAIPPPWVNVVNGMWLFMVKRPPGSPPVFTALCGEGLQPARGSCVVQHPSL
ncbi:unnamed protein product [Closterium sp. NIES-53]